ncbi:MAG: M13 family metallopeptidase [Kofleriaceae bacterium]|nr:M13 family metallopeptidase [Kofleriaceae bacterium]
MKRSLVISACLLAACGGSGSPGSSTPKSSPTTGLDVDGMNRSVQPGDDFFAFANGGWIDRTEIPPDRSSYGTGAVLVELTAKRVADLITEAAASAPDGSDARKIGDYYASFMAEDEIEAKGLAPLKPKLDAIAAIGNAGALARALGATIRADVDAINNTNFETDNLFGLWVAQDLSDPTKYSPFLLQGGLGMPDRDFYVDASPRMAEIREKYKAHVANVLRLAGIAEPDAKAAKIVELENKIAKVHATRTESADVAKANNHWTRKDFTSRAPGMDWDSFFGGAGLAKQTSFVLWQPNAVIGISALVRSEPLETWKAYMQFHAIDHASVFLPKAFVDESFAFYGGVLTGTPKLRDRWKRGVDFTSAAMGEAVGRLYVTKYFPPAEKARAEAMVKNVLAAFSRRIDNLSWMTPATKAKAKAKLAVLKVGVGYPDKWRDYSKLEIVRGDALGNAERAALFEYQRNLDKLGQPVDRGEWVMVPHLVNAVNLPAMNAMNFPAAILQPPYFDPTRPEVMDYASIGAVIGHEISHSFDDQGALFDATGKLENWWTPDDLAHFKASAKQLVAQYDAYKPFPDLAVNGSLTLSENIADVAGLAAAYDAYRLSEGGKEAPTMQGLTGDQQFFVSFAQSWRGKYREAALRQRVVTDGHAPSQYRALTVRNLDAWYAAFKVQEGAKLYLGPTERVRIW